MARLLILVSLLALALCGTVQAEPSPSPSPKPEAFAVPPVPSKGSPTVDDGGASVATIVRTPIARPKPNFVDCNAVCNSIVGPVTHLASFSTTVTQSVAPLMTDATGANAKSKSSLVPAPTNKAGRAAGIANAAAVSDDGSSSDDAEVAGNVNERPAVTRVCTCAAVDCAADPTPVEVATYYPVGWIDCDTIVGEAMAIPTATAVSVFKVTRTAKFGGKQCPGTVSVQVLTTDCPCVPAEEDQLVDCGDCTGASMTCVTSVRSGWYVVSIIFVDVVDLQVPFDSAAPTGTTACNDGTKSTTAADGPPVTEIAAASTTAAETKSVGTNTAGTSTSAAVPVSSESPASPTSTSTSIDAPATSEIIASSESASETVDADSTSDAPSVTP
ncbi:hypothetical protein BC828DRAFT_389698, partial [Blastocladiella britannica]